MWLAYVPSMRNGRDAREDRGCAILSTVPLVDPVAIELPWVAQRRVAVAVTTQPTLLRSAIRIVSVHLDNRPGRREQSDALAQWLGASALDDIPTIVGADLNAWFGSGEETVQQIARVVPLAPGCDERPTFRFGRRLDYLFTSMNVVSCVVDEETYGSDHHPLIMEIGESANSSFREPVKRESEFINSPIHQSAVCSSKTHRPASGTETSTSRDFRGRSCTTPDPATTAGTPGHV
jgi:endonuclease/exonuclease/phosphatase family metal-dependent hydrolase